MAAVALYCIVLAHQRASNSPSANGRAPMSPTWKVIGQRSAPRHLRLRGGEIVRGEIEGGKTPRRPDEFTEEREKVTNAASGVENAPPRFDAD